MEIQTRKVRDLLVKFDTVMLVTQGRDKIQHARPTGLIKVEANCDVWFFTARSSEKTREIQLDQKVILLFQNDQKRYVSLSGRADLISDHTHIADIWKESNTIWFPDGNKDPNPILIRFTSEEAEYWDASEDKSIKHFFAAAKARFTGQPSEPDEPDQHERMQLKPVFGL
jgi:general stress protein 26